MEKIVLIGSGNVATHLGKSFVDNGVEVVQVWSRTHANAQILAEELSSQAISDFNLLIDDADAYIFSVKDDALLPLIMNFPFKDKVLLHTAGSVPMDVFHPVSKYFGVLYPLQTFSKAKSISFSDIPLLIEANDEQVFDDIHVLASKLSLSVSKADSLQRKWLHVSAVFACNFANHLFAVGEQLLTEKGLSFDLLRPLIKETADKAQLFSPKTVQTGPAVREDHDVMNNHIAMLHDNAELKQLYTLMSQHIIESK